MAAWGPFVWALRHEELPCFRKTNWLPLVVPDWCQTACALQFPDPHFKKKHKKRRVVQPQLIQAIDRRLAPGGLVFLQSDVMEVSCTRLPTCSEFWV